MTTQQNNNYTYPLRQSKLVKLTRKSQLNKVLVKGDGRPDYLAINIYWDALRSWYNPKAGYNKDGNVYHIKKLKTPGIFLNYTKLAKEFGCSKATIRRKLVNIEELGLTQRSFQHKSTVTTDSYNQLIVYVWKNTPHFFNEFGIDRKDIPNLTPQTNHKYIEEKHGVVFGSKTNHDNDVRVGGGIYNPVDTKELNNRLISKDIRSNAQIRESNFNSNLISEEDTQEPQFIASEESQKASIHILKPKRVSNKRKKKTKAQVKARKAKVFVFKQYNEKKDLASHYPLTSEDCSKLQMLSGRDFTLNAINEILLDMSKRVGSLFCSKAQFMAYMAKVYKNEKRDAVKVSGNNFKIKANETEESTQLALYEKFLSEVEQQAIDHVCPENQLKAKLAGTLPLKVAYKLLSEAKNFNLVDCRMIINLNTPVVLTESEMGVILSQARAVYGDIDDLEFVTDGAGGAYTDVKDMKTYESKALELPQGVWGEFSEKLIDQYGVDIYKSWFAKLQVKFDSDANTLELSSSSSFRLDWVISKYGDFIRQVTQGMNFEIKYLENR